MTLLLFSLHNDNKFPIPCDLSCLITPVLLFQVYDVTPFMDDHPGGDEVLLSSTGIVLCYTDAPYSSTKSLVAFVRWALK